MPKRDSVIAGLPAALDVFTLQAPMGRPRNPNRMSRMIQARVTAITLFCALPVARLLIRDFNEAAESIREL